MNRQAVAGLLALVATLNAVQAAPYYYYYADPVASDSPVEAGQAQQVAGRAQDTAANAVTQVQQQMSHAGSSIQNGLTGATGAAATGATGGAHPMRERIHSHLSDLYQHGSSAVRGVVETVQPDIKNIGKDLTDVYQQTRTNVGKRIEPLTQTVRPLLDQAQKAVAPYVSQARTEVPKALNAVWTKLGRPNAQQQQGQAGQQQQQERSLQENAKEVVSGEQQKADKTVTSAKEKATEAAKELGQAWAAAQEADQQSSTDATDH